MAAETDPNVQTAVEGMNPEQFQIYIDNQRGCLSSLPGHVPDYPTKRKLLQYAVDSERNAAENLRTVAALTVQANAADANLTAERRNILLASLHQGLFTARTNLKFVNLIANNSLEMAIQVIGAGSNDNLQTADKRKRMDEVLKKARPPGSSNTSQDSATAMLQMIQNAGGFRAGWAPKRDSNPLTMMAAGASRPKISRTKGNSPCFACL